MSEKYGMCKIEILWKKVTYLPVSCSIKLNVEHSMTKTSTCLFNYALSSLISNLFSFMMEVNIRCGDKKVYLVCVSYPIENLVNGYCT